MAFDYLIGGATPPDLNVIGPASATPGGVVSLNTNLVSLRAQQTLDPSVRNLVMIVAGQSNGTDITPSVYAPVSTSKIDQLNIYDGGIYNAVDPLLGTSLNSGGGNPFLRLADSFVTSSLFDRVVLVPIAVGGTAVAWWDILAQSDRIPVAVRRLAAKGLVPGPNVTVVMLWCQGESDGATAQADYTVSLSSIIAKSRTSGFTGPWFIPVQTWNSGAAAAAVQAAQAAIVNPSLGIYAGPNADALVGTACGGVACRQGDNTHFSDAGAASYAAAWKTAMHTYGAPF